MRIPPLEVILAWPTPNYINPVTRGHSSVVFNAIFIAIVTFIVILRLYLRIGVRKRVGMDDAFLALSYIFAVGLTTVVILANEKYGWDRHIYDIPASKFTSTLKLAMSATVLFTCAASFTRISLFCFYYRLVADSGTRWFKWLVHVNVAYTVSTFFAINYVLIFTCRPISNYWNLSVPEDTCMNLGLATFVNGVINCVADVAATITPLPLIWGLNMPRRERIAVCVLFGLGIIVSIAGAVRTTFVYKSLIQSYDQTWYAYPLWISAAIEIDLGVICASVPVLRPLLSRIPVFFSRNFSRGTSAKASSDPISAGATPNDVSRPKHPSTMISTWASGTMHSISEPSTIGKDQNYEMKHWEEVVEQQIMANEDVERGSQASMLNHDADADAESKQGVTRLWKKFRNSEPNIYSKEAMTITRASQIVVESDAASSHVDK